MGFDFDNNLSTNWLLEFRLVHQDSCFDHEQVRHVKGSVRLFSTHCETMARISQNPLSCLYS
jgi:hypothetical protein